jgi:glycosyltransferase involved in cell wall biosynthesis
MSVWAHTLVKNEERYIWFAVMSVIDHVDKILVWDTGSTDATVEVISIMTKAYPDKVLFKEVGDVDITQFTAMRQKMLEETNSDWILILDGDEVWWDGKIGQIKNIIDTKGGSLESIVSRYRNIVGDIFHFQDEEAGRYRIDNKLGNLTIRAFNRNIKGLKFAKPHGQQGIYDNKDVLIQNRASKRRLWFEGYSYLHFTNVLRSAKREDDLIVPKRGFKLKYEIGNKFPADFYYPEVFFRPRPDIAPSPWRRMDTKYFLISLVQTPLRKLKRKIILTEGHGY